MKFLRNLLATITGLVIFSILSFFILLGIFSGIVASAEQEVVVKANSILVLDLNRQIVEKTVEDPFSELMFPGVEMPLGLIDLKEAIDQAKEDDNIKGIYLQCDMIMAGNATLGEIRESLVDFKESGKFVVGYGQFFTEGGYYLASVADELYLHPEASMEFNGLNLTTVFFTGLLEKLEINPVVFRVGEFKSAIEPFVRKDLSEENKEQLTQLVSSIHANMLSDISATRNKSIDELENIADSMLTYQASKALQYGMVDRLAYHDEVMNDLKERVGLDPDKDLQMIKVGKYMKSYVITSGNSNRIAVVLANGEIVMGEGSTENVGADRFIKAIQKAREDDNVKAVVLRINSPGGAALASDIIWRELKLTAEKKPLIASMSDMATSGGYYIAAPCDTIVADPMSITGSIGVVGIMFNFQDFLNEKLGITTEGVQTGRTADIFSMVEPMSEYEKSLIQTGVNDTYDRFVNIVAEGRNMPEEQVRQIAGGRVYSGEVAKDLGLVDVLGDYEEALAIAAEKAGITEEGYKVRFYPKPKTFVEQFLESYGGEVKTKMVKAELGEFYPYYQKVKQVESLRGIQARLPFEFEIR